MEITVTNIVKALWIKYDKDPEKIFKGIVEGEHVRIDDYAKAIEAFDAINDSITCADDSAVEIFNRARINDEETKDVIPLIAWSKSFKNFRTAILDNYDHNVFILSHAPEKVIPKGRTANIRYLSMLITEDVSHLLLYTLTAEGERILTSSSFDEIMNLIKVTCKHIVIVDKQIDTDMYPTRRPIPKEIETAICSKFIAKRNYLYKKGEEVKIMAVPGRKGCLANHTLKDKMSDFVEGWEDIENLVN